MKNKLMVILFGIVLLSLPLITGILPKKDFSENENRILEEFPQLSFSNYTNRNFMKDFEKYIADHFFEREKWIIAKNNMESLSGKTEIDHIITLDNQMVEAWRTLDVAQFKKNCNYINDFSNAHQALSIAIMLAPTIQGIDPDKLPQNADLIDQESFIATCYDNIMVPAKMDVFSTLFQNKEQYIYYRTDHHWTSYGAYLAYREFCSNMGIVPYEISDFTVAHVSNDFRGTYYSKTLDSSIEPDVIDIYQLKEGEPEVTITDYGEEEPHNGLYYKEFLNEKDKYAIFLGRNRGMITVKSSAGNGNSLLIIKDSYAHSLVPFLSKHYSTITMLDLRYANKKMIETIDCNSYTNVLFMYNAKTFTENNGLNLLTYFK